MNVSNTMTLSQEVNPHRGNIENFIGYSEVPTGLIPSVTVCNRHTCYETSVPLSTTEGALVASYSRGCKAISLAGGASAVVVEHGIQRTPCFITADAHDAVLLKEWIKVMECNFPPLVRKRSRYADLKEVKSIIEGNRLNLQLTYYTDDAAGQNMVTFCTEEIYHYILEHSPIKITKSYLESNLSGDKKASSQYLTSVRGRRVVADVTIAKEVVEQVLKCRPEDIHQYWMTSAANQSMSGANGSHGHVANGLAAVFLATGQDIACVAESACAISRFDLTEEGDLYASLTLPSLIVGTVGGGTKLPYAQRHLELMDCLGAGKADRLSEIIATVCLAGELSIAAAISVGHFADAHQRLARV